MGMSAKLMILAAIAAQAIAAAVVFGGAFAVNAGAGAVDRYGRRIPPYRETVDYVRKISSATAKSPATPTASRPPSVVYKTVEVVDGREVERYSTVRPSSGTYQIVGH